MQTSLIVTDWIEWWMGHSSAVWGWRLYGIIKLSPFILDFLFSFSRHDTPLRTRGGNYIPISPSSAFIQPFVAETRNGEFGTTA